MQAARRRHDHCDARHAAASGRRLVCRDLSRQSARRARPFDGDLFPARGRRRLGTGIGSRDAAEVWHFYAGAPLALSIDAEGSRRRRDDRSDRTSPRASGRSMSCRPIAGRRRAAWRLDAGRLHRRAGLRLFVVRVGRARGGSHLLQDEAERHQKLCRRSRAPRPPPAASCDRARSPIPGTVPWRAGRPTP